MRDLTAPTLVSPLLATVSCVIGYGYADGSGTAALFNRPFGRMKILENAINQVMCILYKLSVITLLRTPHEICTLSLSLLSRCADAPHFGSARIGTSISTGLLSTLTFFV